MNQAAMFRLAVLHRGKIAATWKEMYLFSFEAAQQARQFADVTGGMLIRGLERGAVDVAAVPTA